MRPNGSTSRSRVTVARCPKRSNAHGRGKGAGRKKGRRVGGDATSTHWMVDFQTRQDLTLEQWNQPYVESSNFSRNGDESLIYAFMIDRNEPEVLQPQADKVDRFCGKAGLSDCPESHLVMMLDERSCEPGNEGPRADLGPLTPRKALDALRKPVCLPERELRELMEASVQVFTKNDGA